jgi:hypothetical protein
MRSTITVDGVEHELHHARLTSQGTDWRLALDFAGRELALDGQTDGDRLRIDLRSLDELLEQLLGHMICAYPGGQLHNAAHLTVRSERGVTHLSTSFEFDWDRTIDPPGVTYVEPRTLTMEFDLTE